MAYGGRDVESMDIDPTYAYSETRRHVSTSHDTSLSRNYKCAKWWYFLGIDEELVSHFYGDELARYLSLHMIESQQNVFHCISKNTEACMYVHREMDQIKSEIKNMSPQYVFISREHLSFVDKIKGYLNKRHSANVFFKFHEKHNCIDIYCKSNVTSCHEKEVLEEKMKNEVQNMKAEVMSNARGEYDKNFPPLSSESDNSHIYTSSQGTPETSQAGMQTSYSSSLRGSPHHATSQRHLSHKKDPFEKKPIFDTPEGIAVHLMLCSITELKVDVIVNAANESLIHGAGVAKAIADAAGSELIQEGNELLKERNGYLLVTENLTTSPGHLSCQKVIHAVGPRWDDYPDKVICLKDLSDTVEEVLKEASKQRYSTVAFPAISAGIFGVPKPMCAQMYIHAVMKFSRKNPVNCVRKIVFVDLNHEILDEIVEAYRKWNSDPSSVIPSAVIKSSKISSHPHLPSEGVHSDVGSEHSGSTQVSSKSLHAKTIKTQLPTKTISGLHCFELEDGFVTVNVYTGSIAKVRDMSAIVCSADSYITGAGPLSEAIAKEGGQEYVKSFYNMKQKCSFPKIGDILSCHGGKLGVKFVVHVIMEQLADTSQNTLREHKKHIVKVFHKADSWKMKSIAMPLIGGGFVEKRKKDLEKLCKTFYQAVTEYCQQSSRSSRSLREIHFVNKNPEITEAIVGCFQENSSRQPHTYDKRPSSQTGSRRGSSDPSSSKTDNQRNIFSRTTQHQGARPKSGSSSFRAPSKPQNTKGHHSMRNTHYDHTNGHYNNVKETSLLQKEDFNNLGESLRHIGIDESGDEKSEERKNKNGNIKLIDDADDENVERDFGRIKSLNASRSEKTGISGFNDICGSCNTTPTGEVKILQCGHMFCRFPCYLPMEKNKLCFVCQKDSSKLLQNSEYEKASIDQGATGEDNSEEKTCVICMDTIKKVMKLNCGHEFCDNCIEMSFQHKPVCPVCGAIFGKLQGDQPDDGKMTVRYDEHRSLPGFEGHGTIEIRYSFRDGIQQENHPEPGKRYKGTERRAFLPMNEEGQMVLRLLRVAFDRKLTFTIGSSRTTGHENVVTWNDIHHKTKRDTGAARFGYPDPTYLSRVQDELAAKGVTEECLSDSD